MIQINGLYKSYGRQVIFDDVSFTVSTGERIGLVGRNGHGKTTLFRMILGQEHPDAGTISLPSGYSIGHLSQHIRFEADTVLGEACLSLPPQEDGRDETYKAETVLAGLGFQREDLVLHPTTLSGGFQVRLNLAKVLLSDPCMLLLDEPTNYLDIVSMRWLARFLRGWRKEFILITHDRDFMDGVTTHTMAIHRCKIRKVEGTTGKLYGQLLLEEEVHEKTRINDEKRRREAEQFINRFRAKATKARAVQSRLKALKRRERLEELTEIENLAFRFNPAPFTGRYLMEVSSLSFGFSPGGPLLIEDLSFHVGKEDRIAIIGRNGHGKTTLLNLLAGELSPVAGAVRRHRDLRLAYFGQTNIERLNPGMTVEEEIMAAHPERHRGTARSICGAMMFPGDHALKKVGVLSGGEKSRVLLGRLLVTPANMLLLDEPTNHLDMESTESLLEAIKEFRGAVVIVTHSEMILHALATRLIVFDGGKVFLFEGTYSEFLERVGWRSEDLSGGEGLPRGTATRKPGRAKQSSDRKRLRRIRAGLINERARTLGALKVRIDEIEGEIMRLEEETGQHNDDLVRVSAAGDAEAIVRISKALHDATSRIESLFSSLEALYGELDTRTREFQEKLDAVETEL
ncbi:MAG: ATP-binding cassette domain-containing protein [Nitrospirae bacterium]|nr:ATP-binding cassette domain-containing protein [Nitrospirota bacterium]